MDTSAQSTRESVASRDSSRASSRASTPIITPTRRASRVKALSLGDSPVNQIATDLISREQVQSALLTQRTPLSTPRDHPPLAPIVSPHHSNRPSLDDRGSLGGGTLLGSRSTTMLSARGSFEGGLDTGSPQLALSLKDEDGDGVGAGMRTPSFNSRRSSTGTVSFVYNIDPISSTEILIY